MTVTAGAITRAVVYEDREHDTPRDEGHLDRLGEVEQQIQVEISGTAAFAVVWTTPLDITFDVAFIDATGQRYSNLVEPTFTHGAKVDSTSDAPVIVTAVVQSYALDDWGAIVGATVTIGALGGTSTDYGFTGYINLVWQGYGSVPNEPTDPDFTP